MKAGEVRRWGNVTVPYTAVWSGEVEGRLPSVRMERWCGRRVAMLCEGVDAPSGKPLFTILHGERTRRVVRELLCQMCVAPLPAVVVCFSTSAFTDPAYRGRPVIRDGLPMCRACAVEAFDACPGLQRNEAGGRLRIWQTERGSWDHLLVANREVDAAKGGDPRINGLVRQHGGTIYSGPDLHLRTFRRLSLAELRA